MDYVTHRREPGMKAANPLRWFICEMATFSQQVSLRWVKDRWPYGIL